MLKTTIERYTLRRKHFFQNFAIIVMYAVFGTLVRTQSASPSVYPSFRHTFELYAAMRTAVRATH